MAREDEFGFFPKEISLSIYIKKKTNAVIFS